jgi:outer membrane protein OmpA-like peptidoglycan-associated protein
MNPSPFRLITRVSICALLGFATVSAQETRSPLEIEMQQLQIERQKLELEKKQLELQRRQLQVEEATRKELRLQDSERAVTMNLEGDVLFDFGKADIKPGAERMLDKVGTVITQFPEGRVRIEGHTDSVGSGSINRELSDRRAQAVKNWLVKNKGVAESAITTRGFGEEKPVAANTQPDGSDDSEGRQQNRRVQITVEKIS